MIILASNSELRRLIIESSGLTYNIVTREVNERAIEQRHSDKSAEDTVKILAVAKAQAVADDFPDDLIIAADTFGVLADGTRLHKAASLEGSIQLAMRQSGQTTTINTGTAMVHKGKVLSDLTTTYITYLAFDEATVRHLFQLNQLSKRRNAALGFHSDAPGFTLVEKIEGSYLGALGLPMEVIRKNLAAIGLS
jgi:septum formation protein